MPSIPGYVRSPKFARFSAVGISTVGVAAIALTVLPGTADAGNQSQSGAKKVSASTAAAESTKDSQANKVLLSSAKQGTLDADVQRTNDAVADQKEAVAEQKAVAAERAEAAKAKAAKEAAAERKAEAAKASRDAERAKPEKKTYPENLDGWIREARDIMAKHDIPGSYDGIKRNIIRESGGDPNAVNNWDINAQKGTPSKGLLQTIKPTFDAYHVPGTSTDMTDPVANIVAACNYAADRYGSMDNVNSAY
ncbi:lytic transglycosylase [Streptomyces abyssalis]|uniref:Lytic transglycosylase n=1 Tax=Streptomyces abyssalis TaxID=933944 RepID=A0A1E7JKY4_9ACTN|nr:transglycosylase SLT domain-containing protein [Streptomyces abyssalis]OEU88311.1 lytic transglycosylase [Streptomyces abyssalis]OEU91181.1 lytic transglycosylase [Streptomyces abyssalis]OEV30142.1 lytic transglycosylase [Streptomyces nanshensis]